MKTTRLVLAYPFALLGACLAVVALFLIDRAEDIAGEQPE